MTMKRVSRSHQADIDKAVDACADAAKKLGQAIDAWNEATSPLRERIEAAAEAYNEKIAELNSVYTDISQEAADYFSARSERWQEGKAGQAYQEWIDRLEEPDIEEAAIELPDRLVLPGPIPPFTDDSWL